MKTIKVKLPSQLHKNLLQYTKQNQMKLNDFFMVLVDTNLEFLSNKDLDIKLRMFDLMLMIATKHVQIKQTKSHMILKISLE